MKVIAVGMTVWPDHTGRIGSVPGPPRYAPPKMWLANYGDRGHLVGGANMSLISSA